MGLRISITLLTLLWAMQAHSAELNIKISNLTHGSYFTPLLIAAHDENTHLFQLGSAASDSLRIMAECGDITMLSAELVNADKVENPVPGVLAPGMSVETDLMTQPGNSYLSVVAMILPTNDGFVGANNLEIPSQAGTYTFYLLAYDAGTEINNELMDTNGCVAGQAGIPAAPGMDAGANGSGAATAESNTMVHIHRGVLGDTDLESGTSDLDSRVHRWQNPVAKITVTVQ